jgi:ABC-2 type transport system ATP-binding protein
MPTVDVQDLSRWYGQVVGLSGASFTLDPGVTGLLGPNGAGKSTLLKILTGQIRASRGAVRILGQPCWGNAKLFEHVGYVPESDAIYPEMTVQEFLSGFLRLCQVRGAASRQRVDAVLEIVGLDPGLRKPMGAFSKGMRQRARFAQALLMEPEVLLLDEPLNGLDPVGRQDITQLISDLGRQGNTVLISSHILHEIESMTHQVVLLHQGKVMAQGDIHEIRDLIEDRARNVRLRCRDPHVLAARLIELKDVTGVRFGEEPHILIIETAHAEDFFARLTSLGTDPELSIEEVLPLDDDLQSVFNFLIR